MGVDLIRRHHQVGALAAGHDSSGLVESDGDVPGRAALRQEPAAHLPSFDQNVLFERERVDAAYSENLRPVKQAPSVIEGPIPRIGPWYAAFQPVSARSIVQALRPGIGKLALHAVRKAPVQAHLQ